MTKVLQVLPSLVNGGVERGTVEIVAALTAAGHSALVASSGGPMTHDITQAGGKHFTLPLAAKDPMHLWLNSYKLADLIRRHRVDIVHARSRAPAWSALFAARATGRPFVTTFHSAYSVGNPFKRHYNAVMAAGKRVIAISDFVADYVRNNYHVPEDRLRIIPRGVDIQYFDPAKVTAQRLQTLRQNWRLPEGAPTVMLPGRLSGWKGHDVLIEAMKQIDRPDLQTLLVGGGDINDEAALDGRIKQAGLGNRVRQVGNCRDMPAALMLADIVVSPATRPEGFGRVIIEAQAMGRCVIATDHGGARETIIPDKTGWLVPPNDPAALAAAIKAALDLPPERKAQIAADAIAHIRTRFTTAAMTKATLDVYAEVMDRDPFRIEPRSDLT